MTSAPGYGQPGTDRPITRRRAGRHESAMSAAGRRHAWAGFLTAPVRVAKFAAVAAAFAGARPPRAANPER